MHPGRDQSPPAHPPFPGGVASPRAGSDLLNRLLARLALGAVRLGQLALDLPPRRARSAQARRVRRAGGRAAAAAEEEGRASPSAPSEEALAAAFFAAAGISGLACRT